MPVNHSSNPTDSTCSKVCPSTPRRALVGSRQCVRMGQNILSPDLVVEHVEAVSRLVLRLAIQLDLKFPYLTRCCQTHRQSPLLPSFTSTPEVRALSSAGITRPHRSYGPLRLPDWSPPFLATFGAATPGQSRASLTNPDHLLCMPCSIPRWTGSGARWLTSCAIPRRFLPCPCCLPRCRGGSASTSLLSRPAEASHALRPAQLLAHHTWALSLGSALAGYPARAFASYQSSTNNLLGWVLPPLVICAVEALPTTPFYLELPVSDQRKV